MSTTVPSAITADQIAASKESADQDFDEAVQRRFMRAAADAGLVDAEGDLDQELVAEEVYDELKTKRVVVIGSDQDDRDNPATSSTKDELTAAVFTAGPTAAEAEQNDVEKKAYEKCQAAVWNLTQAGRRGNIQKRLEAEKLLLVRGKVFRNGNPIANGVYVSTHEEVVLREFLGPRLEKLRKLTDAIEDDYKMATERAEELAGPMRGAIEAALREATAKLPVAQLGSGESNGQKAIGR